MKLNNIFNKLSKKRKPKLLGRGIGCGKGKTSGRGHKGQKARSGVSVNGFEGGQQSIYTRLPKRGFRSVNKHVYFILNLSDVQKLIETKKIVVGAVVDKEMLYRLGFIRSIKDKVKLLNKGKLTEKCMFFVNYSSESAKKAVTSIGGDVKLLS